MPLNSYHAAKSTPYAKKHTVTLDKERNPHAIPTNTHSNQYIPSQMRRISLVTIHDYRNLPPVSKIIFGLQLNPPHI